MSVLVLAGKDLLGSDRYALVATVTDYDSWRENESPVTAAEVFKTLHANTKLSKVVAETILEELNAAAADGELLTEEIGSMKFSIMPRSEKQKDEDRQKLSYILPTYFGAEGQSGIEG